MQWNEINHPYYATWGFNGDSNAAQIGYTLIKYSASTTNVILKNEIKEYKKSNNNGFI